MPRMFSRLAAWKRSLRWRAVLRTELAPSDNKDEPNASAGTSKSPRGHGGVVHPKQEISSSMTGSGWHLLMADAIMQHHAKEQRSRFCIIQHLWLNTLLDIRVKHSACAISLYASRNKRRGLCSRHEFRSKSQGARTCSIILPKSFQ